MDVIYRYLDVICTNESGEVKIYAEDYDECIDEIKVRTKLRSDLLNRGWIGDLTYSTIRAYDAKSGEEVESVGESTYKDVLLAGVTVYNNDEGYIIWEYRFLKK